MKSPQWLLVAVLWSLPFNAGAGPLSSAIQAQAQHEDMPGSLNFELLGKVKTDCEELSGAMSSDGQKLSAQHPIQAGGWAYFQGRLYPTDFYRSEVYGETGSDVKNNIPPSQIGKDLYYYEYKSGSFALHPADGAKDFLKTYFGGREPITLYRGVTSPTVAKVWHFAKSLLQTPSAPVTADQLKAFDAIAKNASWLKAKWLPVRSKALKMTADQLSTKILGMVTEMQITLTTPDPRAAAYFSGMLSPDPADRAKGGKVMVFQIPPEKIDDALIAGMYGDVEQYYVEIGFSSDAAQKFLARTLQDKEIILDSYSADIKAAGFTELGKGLQPWPSVAPLATPGDCD